MVLPLLPGCAQCEIRFFRFPDESDRHFASSAHRALRLFRLREATYNAVLLESPSAVCDILSQFRHLPRLGQHECMKCGVVVLVRSRSSIETVAAELAAHLESREHESLSFKFITKRLAQLPPHTLPLDFHRYICYACEKVCEFDSFLSLCEHTDSSHNSPSINSASFKKSVTHEYGFTSPLPDYMHVNEDGWSRQCRLCNVTVWSEDDPHLTGKRHRRALSQLAMNAVFDDSDLV